MSGAVDRPVVAVPDEHEPVCRTRGVARDEYALQQGVRVTLEDALVVVGSGVALLAVAQNVLGRSRRPNEEAPLDSRWEGCAAPAAQAGVGDLLNDVGRLHLEQRLVEATIAATRYVLVDVRGSDSAGVAERNPLLLRHARVLIQAGNVSDGVLAEVADDTLVRHDVVDQVRFDDSGNVFRSNVVEKKARPPLLDYVDQRLGEAYSQAPDLVDSGVDAALI